MTRKHFQAIADAIAYDYAEPRPTGSTASLKRADFERAQIRRTAESVASALAQFNPNFDRAKFLTRALPETVTIPGGGFQKVNPLYIDRADHDQRWYVFNHDGSAASLPFDSEDDAARELERRS